MRDVIYPPIIVAAKTAFRVIGNRFQMTGTENIPTSGGVLLAYNHIGYVDFVYGGLAAQPSKRLVRFMGKKELFDHRISGPIMRGCHHIEVDRGAGIGSMEVAQRYLEAGEAVGIFPEATISRAMEIKELKTGATRIAAAAGVPLVPVILWGTQRLMTKDHPKDFSRGTTIAITVGEAMHPTGEDPAGETAALHAEMTTLLDRTIAAYPADEQPPGSWWLPRRHGGSAPTLEEAVALDAAEKRERAARRAAQRAAKSTDRPAD